MFNLYLTGGDALLCIILSVSFVVAINKACNEGEFRYLNFKVHLFLFQSFIQLHPKIIIIKNLLQIRKQF